MSHFSARPDALILGRKVLTPQGIKPMAIEIKAGRIQRMRPPDPKDRALAVLDAGDRLILPGFVDTHVHLNEPGRTEWEGFSFGTRAAVAGGITTLIDMPLNSDPVTTTVDALRQKRDATQGQRWADLGFWGGVIPGNQGELAGMVAEGARGFKCFLCPSGIDEFPPATEADLRQAMPLLRELGVPLLVHAELCPEGMEERSSRRYADYLASRPPSFELEAIALILRLCEETGCAVHIVHLSTAQALPLISRAKAQGLPVSVETCPHYLHFAAEQIPDGATHFKCAPPIREADNREALWQGLREGLIDFVACDHSPCTPALKELDSGDFNRAWGGIASLQLAPSVVWTEAKSRGFRLQQLTGWLCQRTASFAGLLGQKGTLAPGYDADFVVWDPDASFVVQASTLHHRHPLTPYMGETLFGQVHSTWLRGQPVFTAGQHGNPQGRLLSHRASGAI